MWKENVCLTLKAVPLLKWRSTPLSKTMQVRLDKLTALYIINVNLTIPSFFSYQQTVFCRSGWWPLRINTVPRFDYQYFQFVAEQLRYSREKWMLLNQSGGCQGFNRFNAQRPRNGSDHSGSNTSHTWPVLSGAVHLCLDIIAADIKTANWSIRITCFGFRTTLWSTKRNTGQKRTSNN